MREKRLVERRDVIDIIPLQFAELERDSCMLYMYKPSGFHIGVTKKKADEIRTFFKYSTA
jgi:hypothetical protein